MDYFSRVTDAVDDVRKTVNRVGYAAQWVALAAVSVFVVSVVALLTAVAALVRT